MTELFDELAGKYEYSAGMTRADAEARARRELETKKEPEQVELFKPVKVDIPTEPELFSETKVTGNVDYFAIMRKKFKEIEGKRK